MLLKAVAGTVALSGCMSDSGTENTSEQSEGTTSESSGSGTTEKGPVDYNTKAKFEKEGTDLLVYHSEGDVLPEGETLYVTIDGEKVKETTLGSTVYAGGEIMRVADANLDYTGETTVALYVQTNDEPLEISTAQVSFSSPPAVALDFEYKNQENSVSITHSGGNSLNSSTLSIIGDADDTPIEPSVDGKITAGSTFYTHEDIQGVESGDQIQLKWVAQSGNGAGIIESFTAP